MSPALEKSCVRLFLSADLVGSTAYKNKLEVPEARERGGPAWFNVFSNFYNGFPKMFERELEGQRLEAELRPKLVKTIGDELLLQSKIRCSADAGEIVRFFAKALVDYRRRNLSDGPLLLKGTAWIAGFPINNCRVRFEDEGGHPGGEDFIGPSIDTGFRIAHAASTPSKLVVSLDLALLMLAGDRPLDLYFDGTVTLRGVLGGRPYPIVWYKVAGEDAKLHDAELKLRDHTVRKDELRKYCEEYIQSCTNTWLIRPYFENDPDFQEKPEWHRSLLETWQRLDRRNQTIGPETEGVVAERTSRWPEGDGVPAKGRGKSRSRRPPPRGDG